MEKFYTWIHQLKIAGKFPKKSEINFVFHTFSKKEWIIFLILAITLFVSTISILETLNKRAMVKMPFHGGDISIGIIGTPRFINPVLASSPADLDLVSLIYSGLMRKNEEKNLIPDLAEKYEMSKDGLTYTFTLKDKIYFHNGETIKADDVVFTINKIKNSIIKSPQKINWDGINVTKINDTTIEFNLKQPYPSFLENTTLGIMPESIWNNSPIELNDTNTNPIGSGPYMIKKIIKESSGIINSYELIAFEKFILGEPYIQNINLHFYLNEDNLISGLEDGTVNQISSISPINAEILKGKNYQIKSLVLPRIFGLFFNQNQNQLFTNKVITNAINQAIDKDKIVREVLSGYGVAIDRPIPPNMIAHEELEGEKNTSREQILKNVENNLKKDGWIKNASGFLQKVTTDKNKKKTNMMLEFSISTGNAPELTKTAELIKQDLLSIGIKVDVKTFEVGNLNESVIRPRKYDALLFGQIINRESDLYAFWHSSQRKDPGLNVSMYTNLKVDKILEEAFITIDEKSRIKKYTQFEDEIKKDMPAVFLYSPDFIYLTSDNIKGPSINQITSTNDRFSNIYLWYTETQNVWKIFAH